MPDIDKLVGDAAGMLTDVAGSTDRAATFLGDLDPTLANVAGTIGDTIDDSVRQLGGLDADLARAGREVPGALDGVLSFLGDLDSTLAGVEKQIGIINDTVRYLRDLDGSLAVTERAIDATLDGTLKYLGGLDAALADLDGVAAANLDGALIFLRDLGATLADAERIVTENRDGLIFTRDSITKMLEQWVVEIRAEDLAHLVAPADAVLADVERTVADMTAGVRAARDTTEELLDPIEVGIRTEDLIGWAEWIEALGFDAALLRDWAAYIEPGLPLFPREVRPGTLIATAVLLEGAGLDATWLRDEADRWARENLILPLTAEKIAELFDPAIGKLELASAGLAQASAWLHFWPGLLEELEEREAPLRLFPLEMTADDVDAWADAVEAAGLDATWLRAEADRLRQYDLIWRLTPQDFALAFAPVIEGLEVALVSLTHTAQFMEMLQINLGAVRQLAADNIAGTRELLKLTRANLADLEKPALDSIAGARELLRRARTSLAAAERPIRDGLSGSREALQATERSVENVRSPVIEGIAGTRELLGTARTSLGDLKQPALGGISDTRAFLKGAQADLGGLGGDLRGISADIVGIEIGGRIDEIIGWIQTYMIITSILFMAAGVGLFLVGMKKAESSENLTSEA